MRRNNEALGSGTGLRESHTHTQTKKKITRTHIGISENIIGWIEWILFFASKDCKASFIMLASCEMFYEYVAHEEVHSSIYLHQEYDIWWSEYRIKDICGKVVLCSTKSFFTVLDTVKHYTFRPWALFLLTPTI